MNTQGRDQLPIKVALAGCGRISQVHFQTIAAEPRAQLVGVADIDEQAARRAGEAYGVPSFADLTTLLDAVPVDAVILCTPPSTHCALSTMALEHGAHVLCEKPLALTVEEAHAMVEGGERAERLLMMASKFRYVQDVVQAKWMIESGILGEVVLFENEFCSHVDMKARWNADREIAGGGVLIDNGSHSVDIYRYLCGPVVGVQATFGKRWQRISVEDTCHLLLQSTDNTIGSIDLSWSIHKEDPYFIHVFGTEGMLQIGWKGSRYRQNEKADWVPFGTGYDKVRAVGAQLANFLETIAGRASSIISAKDALESVRVIQSAYRTANQAHWEEVTG